MAKRFLIVRPGETAPEIERRFGHYDRWFASAMAPHRVDLVLCDATREPIPSTNGFSGVIVTGSASSVCQPDPWMERLSDWLSRAEDCGLPVLGVCYGCQLLAAARGGRVVRNPRGWEIGAVEVELAPAARIDPLFEGAPSPLPVLATHEDRVEVRPDGAVLLAGNRNSPVQAFRIGDRIWGVQFHPEASAALIAALIRLRRTQLEEDADRHGLPVEGYIDRLLTGVDRIAIEPGRKILDRFVAIC